MIEEIVPNAFVATVTNIPNNRDELAIYDVTFTTVLPVPSGPPQATTTDTQGQIELVFNGANILDLGTGAVDGGDITCNYITGILPIGDE